MNTDIGVESIDSQREFVTSALLGRLSDDDPAVVLAVLNLKAKVCINFMCIFVLELPVESGYQAHFVIKRTSSIKRMLYS